MQVDPGSLTPVGVFAAPAANEAGTVVEADVFRLDLVAPALVPAAEIEELRWIDPFAEQTIPLAPLTRDHVLPLARKERGGRRKEA